MVYTAAEELSWLRRVEPGKRLDLSIAPDVLAQLVKLGALTYKPVSGMYEVGEITDDMIARLCPITHEADCESRDCELHYMDAPLRLAKGEQ